MKILSIKCSYKKLKFKLFNMDNESIISYGEFNHIGDNNGRYIIKYEDNKIDGDIIINDYVSAVRILTEKLLSLSIIESIDDIDVIGHYIILGEGNSIIINEDVINRLKENEICIDNLLGIEAFKELMPNKTMVGVFDNSFHSSIDEVNYLYPVPIGWYRNYNIRKYGYSGIRHSYISSEVSNLLGDNYKLISIDLDKDSSVCAIKDNKSVDISNGFRMTGGIMNGTRSGSIDPSIIPYVMEKEGKNIGEILDDLNNNSGLIGISEVSSDIDDIVISIDEGNKEAILAKDMFIRSIVDYVGSYYLLLDGCDIIVFSSDDVSRYIPIRREICEKLSVLGIKIDLDLNQKNEGLVKISTDDSKIQVYITNSNEGLMIARESMNLVRNGN